MPKVQGDCIIREKKNLLTGMWDVK
jgi:hypothetical protein